jgi:hypothetical protein
MKGYLAAGLGFAVCAVLGAPIGCSSKASTLESAATISGEGSDGYFLARREACSTEEPCGYQVRELGVDATWRHVDTLDFSQTAFDQGTVHAALKAPPQDLVLHGSLGADVSSSGAATRFVVREAFRGLPSIRADPNDAFYVVEDRPSIGCSSAACTGQVAVGLDTSVALPVREVRALAAAAPHVDQNWLESRILRHGAVFAAHVAPTEVRTEEGAAVVMDASQVYVRLPDHGGPCLLQHRVCRPPLVAVYARDENRCIVWSACIEPRPCLPATPVACESGYTLVDWPADNLTCRAFACDPTFLSE